MLKLTCVSVVYAGLGRVPCRSSEESLEVVVQNFSVTLTQMTFLSPCQSTGGIAQHLVYKVYNLCL